MIGIPRVPLLLPALACLCFAATAQPAAADTQAFGFTGFEQTYVVPDRVHAVRVVAAGGRGGVGSDNPMGSGGTFFGGLAGFGARVEADLAVAPGQALFVEVGSNGGDGAGMADGLGGYNGGGTSTGDVFNRSGGGGGGGTDVRTCSIFAVNCQGTPNTLSSRVLVAGGGGGGGGEGRAHAPTGGGGGDAGMGGRTGSPCLTASPGGGAGPGTDTGGGSGGSPGLEGEGAGDPGTLAEGGGAPAMGANAGARGGGGGGGYFGGGGGGAGCGSGGGGGGSSFAGAGTSNASMGTDSTGIPLVTITSAAPPPNRLADFTFGRSTHNKRAGTAVLAVELPGPGTLRLSGSGLLARGPLAVPAAGEDRLGIRATGKQKRRLRRTGNVNLTATVTFTPAGQAAIDKLTGIGLIRRR